MAIELDEVVMRLVGPIRPVGETNADAERYENLAAMCALIEALVCAIDAVAMKRGDERSSVRRAGSYAHDFLENSLGIRE